jgi:MoxR-like ATPase
MDDVKALAKPVLRHRIITTFTAEADGISPDEIVEQLVESIPE